MARDTNGEIQGLDYPKFTSVIVRAIQQIWLKITPILAWFGDDGKLRVQNDICVDDTCVTKEQFKNLLLNAAVGATQYSNTVLESNDPNIDTSESQDPPQNTEETTSSTTPELIEEPEEIVAETPTPSQEEVGQTQTETIQNDAQNPDTQVDTNQNLTPENE